MLKVGPASLYSLERYSKRLSRRNLYTMLEEALEAYDVRQADHVLNIGAGGEIERHIREHGVRPTTLDIDPDKKPDLVQDIMQMKTIADETIDVVICMEVLEHVANPFAAMHELSRVLRPGGVVIGSTPFILGIHLSPHDYFRFTEHGIRLLFKDFDEKVLVSRNSYLAAVSALIMRLYASATRSRKSRLLAISPALLGVIGQLAALDLLVDCEDATTGYFYVFQKPVTSE